MDNTHYPIRYFDGEVMLSVKDIQGPSGDVFGMTRSYNQRLTSPYYGPTGYNWFSPQQPQLMIDHLNSSALIVVYRPNNPVAFDPGSGSTHVPRFNPSDAQVSLVAQTITVGSSSINLQVYQEVVNGLMTQIRFYDYDQPGLPMGQMYDTTDPWGVTTQAIYSSTTLTELVRTWTANGVSKLQRLVFSYYVLPSANAGETESVVFSTGVYVSGTLTWTVVRGVTYTYYGSGSSNGSMNDLQSATITDQSGNLIDTSYYRYDNGGLHQLAYVFGPASYARLAASQGATTLGSTTLSTVDGTSNTVAAPYADNAFTYDGYGRITQEIVQGEGCSCSGSSGQGTYTYAYAANSTYSSGNNVSTVNASTSNWPNIWINKTTETLPDSSQNIVYTNFAREVIMKRHLDPAGTSSWIWYNRYDSSGDLYWAAEPSAVSGYDETQNDLVDVSGTPYGLINASSGLIHVFDYASSTSGTISSTVAGNVVGQLQDEQVQNGRTGTPIMLRSYQYFKHAADVSSPGDGLGNVVYPLATLTEYNTTTGSGAQVTSFTPGYVATSGLATTVPLSMTVSEPVISSGENGPGSADVSKEYYDVLGRLQWTMDADGYINYVERDNASGAVTLVITDVQYSLLTTAQQALFPTGWSYHSSGLNLTTTMVNDDLGRMTQVTDAVGYVSYVVYNDASSSGTGPNHEVRVYPGWVSISGGLPTGPTQLTRTDRFNSYTESLTMSATPATSSGVPTGQESVSSVQTLSRSYEDQSGRVVRSDAYFNLSGLTYATSTYIGTQWTSPSSTSANYYTTTYGFDTMGRQNHVVNANGTITDSVYEVSSAYLDRMGSVSVGTNDTTGSSNMVKVADYFYDGGTSSTEAPAGGDNTLTQVIQYPDTTSSHNRESQMVYDWRDRLVATKAGVQSSEDTSTHRPIVYCMLDNLGRCTTRCQYDGDTLTLSLTAPSQSVLRKRVDTSYDDQNRPYQVKVYDINQSNGNDGVTGSSTLSSGLVANMFYDHRGDVIESVPPGAPVSKATYDGAGRLSKQYVTDGSAGTGWSAAGTVTGDNVLQSAQYTYDGNGSVVMTTSKQRFNDTTATGELGNSTTSPKAWVSFATAYYDPAGRVYGTVQLGRVSGDTYTAPVQPGGSLSLALPTASDTVLVSSMTYNAAGWVSVMTDPKGLQTAKAYDAMGRTTQMVEAWDGSTTVPLSASSVGAASNRATNYVYDGVSHTYQLTAVMPTGTNSQTTQYNYGIGSSGQLYSNDLLASVQYPSRTAGTPGTTSADKQTYTYDYLGEAATFVDQNQTTHTYTYDVLSRRIGDSVGVYSGNPQNVDTTVLSQTINFDTGDRPYQLTSYSAASGGGSVVNQVQFAYNGLGQLTVEYQNHSTTVNTSTSPKTQYAYVEMASSANNSRLTGITYPNTRVVYYNYNDAGDTAGVSATISRVTALSNNTTRGTSDANVIASYTYLGLATPVQKNYPTPQVRLDLWGGTTGTYTGLDAFQRIASQDWTNFSGTQFDVFNIAHGYDRDSNRLYASNVTQPATGVDQPYTGSSHVYTYDNLNRLTNDAKGLIASGNGSIQSSWQTMNDHWTLDTLGNQTAGSAGSDNNSMVLNTPDSINEYTANAGSSNGFANELNEQNWNNWAVPSGSTATYSYGAGGMQINTVTTDTFNGHTESEARAVVLWAADLGPCWTGSTVVFPTGATTGQAGWVFGYKGINDYWVELYDLGAQCLSVYHVVNGSKTLIQSNSTTVVAGTIYSLISGNSRTWLSWPANCTFTNGLPDGKTGVYSNVASVKFNNITAFDVSRPFPMYNRWDGTRYFANAYGMITQNGAAAGFTQGPAYLKNLRLQKFQATFVIYPYNTSGSYNRTWFVFNGKDRDDYDLVGLTAATTAYSPEAYITANGAPFSAMSGTYSSGPADPGYTPSWFRVQFDGTTLSVWQLLSATTPTESAWSTSATQILSSTGCRTTGGMIGFSNTDGGYETNVNQLTIKSWDTSTSAFDVTEAFDTFAIDGSNNGNNTLASDSNGNQTFDGSQFYTYDAWNRLMTVSHGYRDASNNLQHGQASVTNSYDARGRRITKAVADTGSWDCTYNYYYAGWSCIEQQNGSAETIKQYVLGTGYVDDLVQISLNSSPTTQSTCDTPYWIEQDAGYNVLGIVNVNGVLTERYEYSAYGQRTVLINAGSNDVFCMAPTVGSTRFVASGSSVEPYGLCEMGYQGLIHDEESGLISARRRSMDVQCGRYLQRDPLLYSDSLNVYETEKSSPCDRLDSLGESSDLKVPNISKLEKPIAQTYGSWYWEKDKEMDGSKAAFGKMPILLAFALDKNQGICCTKIGIVQLARLFYTDTNKGYIDSSGVDLGKWHVDAGEDNKTYLYQNGKIDGELVPGDFGNVCGGKFKQWSAIQDQPEIPPGTTHEFQDYVVCEDGGANQGKIFGQITWGAQASIDGIVTPMRPKGLDKPIDEFNGLTGNRYK